MHQFQPLGTSSLALTSPLGTLKTVSKPSLKSLIGTTYAAGRLLAILLPSGANRGLRARFRCSSCGRHDVCRLSDLKRGVVASCGCKSKEQFLRFTTDRANAFAAAYPSRAEAIWRTAEVEGLDAAARQHGLDRPLVSAIYRQQRVKAAAQVTEKARQLVYVAAQRIGYTRASIKLGMSLELVMAVSRLTRRVVKAVRATSDLAAGRLRDALDIATGAMIALTSMPGRYQKGEFDKIELPAPSKAKNSPIQLAADFLSSASIPARFRPLADRFIAAVTTTRKNRKDRSVMFNRRRAEGFGSMATAA